MELDESAYGTAHDAELPAGTDANIRCKGISRFTYSNGRVSLKDPCNRYLADYATRPWRIVCPRCKHANEST